MRVIHKDNNRTYEVYDIVYDTKGYPHFLIYDDGQWKRISAKHFKPDGFKPYSKTAEEVLNDYVQKKKLS